MTNKFKVKLLRPLDDEEIGAEVEFNKADAERLAEFGAVKILGAVEEKAKPEPENKMEAAPQNKVAGKPAKKAD